MTILGYQCRHDTIWRNNGETIYLHQPDGNIVNELWTHN